MIVGSSLHKAPASRSRVVATWRCSICGKLAWNPKSKVLATSPSSARLLPGDRDRRLRQDQVPI